jgi:hypothetical protein
MNIIVDMNIIVCIVVPMILTVMILLSRLVPKWKVIPFSIDLYAIVFSWLTSFGILLFS